MGLNKDHKRPNLHGHNAKKPFTNSSNPSEYIPAWKNSTPYAFVTNKESSSRINTKRAEDVLLQSVEKFLADSNKVANTTAVTSNTKYQDSYVDRLYKSELARNEANTKLKEWIKVASELQAVVTEQQRHLDKVVLFSSNPGNNNTRNAIVSTSTDKNIAQLQKLVKAVRKELRLSEDDKDNDIDSRRNTGNDNARLLAEIQSLKRQLANYKSIESQKCQISTERKEAAALSAQIQTQRHSALASRSEHEHARGALVDAEMELHKSKTDIVVLKQKIEEYEARSQEQSRQVAAAHAQTAALQDQIVTAQRHAETLAKDKADAIQLAGDATSEAGRLEVERAHVDAQLKAAQQAAQAAVAAAAAAESKAAAAEAAIASEQSQRASLEAETARMRTTIASLEASLAEGAKKSVADNASWSAQLDALQQELSLSQQATRMARREMESYRNQIETLTEAHSSALSAAKCAQEKLKAAQTDADAALRRATLAETQSASTIAIMNEREAQTKAQLTLQYETEVKALKEILDKMAVTAQQKDAALQLALADMKRMEKEKIALIESAQIAQNQVVTLQTDAAREFAEYEAQIKAAHAAIEQCSTTTATTPPADTADQKNLVAWENWRQGDPIPDALQQYIDDQVGRARATVNAAVEVALAKERREHAAAVRALEEAHIANLEASQKSMTNHLDSENSSPIRPEWHGSASELRRAYEAAESEAMSLREELRVLRDRGSLTQGKLKAVETELRGAQDTTARLTSTIVTLEDKLSKSEQECQTLKQKLETAEKEYNSLKQELADAQDEVEALLSARITQLSRQPSVAGDIDQYEKDDGNVITGLDNNDVQEHHHHNDVDYIDSNNDDDTRRELSSSSSPSRQQQPPHLLMHYERDFGRDDVLLKNFNGVESDEEDILDSLKKVVHSEQQQAAAAGPTHPPLLMHHHSWDDSAEAESIQAIRNTTDTIDRNGSLTSHTTPALSLQPQHLPLTMNDANTRHNDDSSDPQPPKIVFRGKQGRSSPLKKLANMLRGKKVSKTLRDDASGGGDGPVRRNLVRSENGTIQWQPQ